MLDHLCLDGGGCINHLPVSVPHGHWVRKIKMTNDKGLSRVFSSTKELLEWGRRNDAEFDSEQLSACQLQAQPTHTL